MAERRPAQDGTFARRVYEVTLTDETVLALARIVGRSGGPRTPEEFLRRAIGYGMRGNHQSVQDADIGVREVKDDG